MRASLWVVWTSKIIRFLDIFWQVNENGLVSFLTEIPSYFNIEFPSLDYPIISVLYSDVDCRTSGVVWYRVSRDSSLLNRAASEVRASFSEAANFQPEELFIVTWDQVGYYEQMADKVRTCLFRLDYLKIIFL